MTYNKREKDKYNIHLIQTDKFKTITINAKAITPAIIQNIKNSFIFDSYTTS